MPSSFLFAFKDQKITLRTSRSAAGSHGDVGVRDLIGTEAGEVASGEEECWTVLKNV
jgi:hypothetical protein